MTNSPQKAKQWASLSRVGIRPKPTTRKYFQAATGRNVPGEAYRVVLQRELIPAPVDITLTKFENGQVFLTECRFIHEGNLRSFRYDPRF